MKRILYLASVILLVSFCACHEVSYEGKTNVLQDSLINIFPTWQAAHIEVSDDKASIIVAIGDLSFYKASPEVKQKKAEELGAMIMRIYGKGNYLEKGTLIVTKDIRNTSAAPADGISTPMDLEGIKKKMW